MPQKVSNKRNFKINSDHQHDPQPKYERKLEEGEEMTEKPYMDSRRELKHNYRGNNISDRNRKILGLLLKYSCRLCGKYTPKVLHPSNFMQKCKSCNSASHLKNLSSSFKMLMGTYECQQKRCGVRWVQRLPFKNVIMNTPVCDRCHKLTKIIQIFYNGVRVTFKDSLLYKCNICSKSKSISTFIASQMAREKINEGQDQKHIPSTPECENCHVPMNFIKSLRSLLFGLASDRPPRRAKSLSPQNRSFEPRQERGDFIREAQVQAPLGARLLQHEPFSKYSHPQRGALKSRGYPIGGAVRGGHIRSGRGRGGHFYSSRNYLPRPERFAKSHGDSPKEAEENSQENPQGNQPTLENSETEVNLGEQQSS